MPTSYICVNCHEIVYICKYYIVTNLIKYNTIISKNEYGNILVIGVRELIEEKYIMHYCKIINKLYYELLYIIVSCVSKMLNIGSGKWGLCLILWRHYWLDSVIKVYTIPN